MWKVKKRMLLPRRWRMLLRRLWRRPRLWSRWGTLWGRWGTPWRRWWRVVPTEHWARHFARPVVDIPGRDVTFCRQSWRRRLRRRNWLRLTITIARRANLDEPSMILQEDARRRRLAICIAILRLQQPHPQILDALQGLGVSGRFTCFTCSTRRHRLLERAHHLRHHLRHAWRSQQDRRRRLGITIH